MTVVNGNPSPLNKMNWPAATRLLSIGGVSLPPWTRRDPAYAEVLASIPLTSPLPYEVSREGRGVTVMVPIHAVTDQAVMPQIRPL